MSWARCWACWCSWYCRACLRPPRAQAVARQPGPRGRLERHRGRGAERHPGGAELHGGDARGEPLRCLDRQRLPHRRAPRQGALGAGRLHHHRDLGRVAVGTVPGHASGAARHDHRGPSGRDGGVRDHPGRCRRRARRGLWRPAARGRRHRTADGAAARPLGHRVADATRRRPGAAGRQQRRLRRRDLPLPVAAAHARAARLQSLGRTGRNRGAGRCERRRQEHGLPAAAALLRPGHRPHRAGRRAARDAGAR
jgi:hypothetical protein